MRFTAFIIAACLLLSVGVANAADTGYRSPEHAEGATTINVDEAKWMFDEGVTFIDVRNPRFFARRHVPGAHHLDLKDGYSERALNAIAGLDDPVVIYSSGEQCSRSYRASEMAVNWGYTKVYYFRGGIIDWRDAGLPMEKVNILLEGAND